MPTDISKVINVPNQVLAPQVALHIPEQEKAISKSQDQDNTKEQDDHQSCPFLSTSSVPHLLTLRQGVHDYITILTCILTSATSS